MIKIPECHERASINQQDQCQCDVGYAGDGFDCGLDSVSEEVNLEKMDYSIHLRNPKIEATLI